MAVQGPVISWVADHRKHHAHTDSEGDPHSPHVGRRTGLRGVAAGLWHAHAGWLLSTQGRADWKRYAADLDEDPGMRPIARQFVPGAAHAPTRHMERQFGMPLLWYAEVSTADRSTNASGWPYRPWASPGITITTPSPARGPRTATLGG